MTKEIEYIYDIPKFSKKASIANTREMLNRLGNPERFFKIIHVAGTNGKGSVCAYMDKILRMGGHTTGLFTSPHLVRMNERIVINGHEIEDKQFEEAFNKVKTIALDMEKDGFIHPSFFEFIFGMAMYVFMKNKVEYIILETGLGGRLDATNAIIAPIMTIITSISLDHTEYLGNTYDQIAKEKAGIIKKTAPVVFADNRKDVEDVILQKAKAIGAKAIPCKHTHISNVVKKDKYIDFYLNNDYYCNVKFTVHSEGLYQVENAAIAATAAKCLEIVDDTTIINAIEKTFWAGRMQEILPEVYLDGAHNDDGIDNFINSVRTDKCTGRRILLFSAVSDKHHAGMINRICESRLFDHIITGQLNDKRGLDISDMISEFDNNGIQVEAYKSIKDAFYNSMKNMKNNDRLYCAGSLYLVGEIMAIVEENKND